ncbi:hypothetical protein N325_09366, partial [Colius striatus]
EPDVFEIVLPITVFELSDEDFLQDDAEEPVAPVLELKQEDVKEVNSSNTFSEKSVTSSSDANSLNTGEENETTSKGDDSVQCSEEKCIAESVCNESKLSLSDWCYAGKDKY